MKRFTTLLLILTIVLLLVACGNNEGVPTSNDLADNGDTTPTETETDLVDMTLLGFYECTGYDVGGTRFEPTGEWLELKADGSGTWFLGATEDDFDWVLEDNDINFELDVGLQYTATLKDDEIVLNTGMLYYFAKGGTATEETDEALDDISIDLQDIEVSFDSDDYGEDGRVYTSTGTMEMQIPEDWEVDIALHESTIGVRSPEYDSDIIRASCENYSSMIKNPEDRTPENQAKQSGPSDVSIVKDNWGNTEVWYYIYKWSDRTEIKGFGDYSDEQYLSFDIRVKAVNGTVEEFMESDAWNTLRTTFELKKP